MICFTAAALTAFAALTSIETVSNRVIYLTEPTGPADLYYLGLVFRCRSFGC